MIRKLAYPLIMLAAKLIDQTVPQKQLRGLLLRGLEDLENRPAKDDCDAKRNDCTTETARMRQTVSEAGLLDDTRIEDASVSDTSEGAPGIALEQLDEWIEKVPDGKVVTARRLAMGTGQWLDRIQSAGYEQHCEFVDRNLQSLLRHVEIRGAKCLHPLFPMATPAQQWLEKHDVAILFARSARRRQDLRLLNAAMKLNDWSYPSHRKMPVTPRYLLALAEQEKSVLELMK